jgi:glycosyltransferase involved in cell wall biosynthesis
MNSKESKIIFFSQPSLNRKRAEKKPYRNPGNDIFYLGDIGIAHHLARHIKTKYPKRSVEIWRLDETIDSPCQRIVGGILGKVYPYRKIFGIPWSKALYTDLKQEELNNKLLIWFDGLHNKFFICLSFLFRSNKQFAHNLGGENFLYKFRKTRKLKYKLASLIERIMFIRNIDRAFLCTEKEIEYFNLSIPRQSISSQYVVGIDLNRWKIIPKDKARRILELPLEKKIILQSGRAMKNKGTHITLNAWENDLKRNNIELIITGVHEGDELFPLIKEIGCTYYGLINHELMPVFMAAADVYVYPPFDEITLNFAGVGYAPLEALACGTPVVATTASFLSLYGISTSEYVNFIKIPKDENDVAVQVMELIEKTPDPQACRQFITKHFSQDKLFGEIEEKLKQS